jgi:hypothetical protein
MAKPLLLTCLAICAALSTPLLSAQKSSEARGAATATRGATIAKALPGSWRLVSVETVRPNGEIIYPFYGKHPKGLLIYDRTGWMGVQIVSDPEPTVPTPSSREKFAQASASEKAEAIDGFYAYYGTWSVDDAGTTVTHHIKESLYPGERDTDGARQLSLTGKRLTLIAKTHEMGEDHERKLVWERIEPLEHLGAN